MRNTGTNRYFESPMRPVRSTLLDPFPENRDLTCAHRLGVALRTLRHQIFRVFGLDSLDQFALLRMTRNDCVAMALALLHCPFSKIEPQTRLTHFRIWPVTTEAST